MIIGNPPVKYSVEKAYLWGMKRILPPLLILALSACSLHPDRLRLRMKENFRLGCELIEEGEYPRAHVILVQALEDATTLEDSLSMGQILSRDGFILHKSGNVKEALAAYQKAFDIFHQAGNDQQFRQAALDLARAYEAMRSSVRADSLCRMVYAGSEPTDTLSLQAMILQADILTHFPHDDFQRAKELYEQVLQSDNRDLFTAESYLRYILCLSMTEEKERAIRLADRMRDIFHSPERDFLWFKIAQALGDDQQALQSLLLAYTVQSFNDHTDLQSSVFMAQSDYYRQSSELAAEKNRSLRLRIALLLTAMLLVMLLGGLLFLRYRKHQQDQTERLIAAAEESRRLLEEQARGADTYRQLFAAQYQAQFAAIGRLAEPFISSDRIGEFKARASRDYSEQLDAILQEITNTRSKDFEKRLNRDLDNVVSRLRTEFPQLREQDIRFLCYQIAGFETSTIAFLLDMSKGNIRVRKHRLRTLITASDSPDRDFFLSLIG